MRRPLWKIGAEVTSTFLTRLARSRFSLRQHPNQIRRCARPRMRPRWPTERGPRQQGLEEDHQQTSV